MAPESEKDRPANDRSVEGNRPDADEIALENESSKSKELRWFQRFGPGFLVAAAFIGPGTVNTAIKAGGGYGFHLLWGVGFAVIATIVFQEMAARLGLVAKKGLAEALVDFFPNAGVRKAVVGVVFAAIIFGNAAYQAGNLAGASAGLNQLFPGNLFYLWLVVCSGGAWCLVWMGTFKLIKNLLMGLVLTMSLTFLFAAIASGPSMPDLFAGSAVSTFRQN